MTMPDQTPAAPWQSFRRTYYTVALAAAALLLVLWLLGCGPGGRGCPVPGGANTDSGTASVSSASTATKAGDNGTPQGSTPAAAADAQPLANPATQAGAQAGADKAPATPATAPAAAEAGQADAAAARAVGAAVGTATGSSTDPGRRLTFYFASDRAELPEDAPRNVFAMVTYLKANPQTKVRLSGFHDANGPAEYNQRLAQARARSVRALLVASGVAPERILTPVPQATLGSGPAEQARRVDLQVE